MQRWGIIYARLVLIRELMASIRRSTRTSEPCATEQAIRVNEELNLMLAPLERAELACSQAIECVREQQRGEVRGG